MFPGFCHNFLSQVLTDPNIWLKIVIQRKRKNKQNKKTSITDIWYIYKTTVIIWKDELDNNYVIELYISLSSYLFHFFFSIAAYIETCMYRKTFCINLETTHDNKPRLLRTKSCNCAQWEAKLCQCTTLAFMENSWICMSFIHIFHIFLWQE